MSSQHHKIRAQRAIKSDSVDSYYMGMLFYAHVGSYFMPMWALILCQCGLLFYANVGSYFGLLFYANVDCDYILPQEPTL